MRQGSRSQPRAWVITWEMDSQQGRHGGLPQAENANIVSLPSCNSKSEEPADGPRRALENSLSGESLAPHAVTRDAWDVGTHDAEIGKLTVGEQVELTLGGVVTVPTLEAVAEEVEHGLSPMD